MTIKYISLFSLFVVTGAHAILPDEIVDVAYNRYAKAHQDLLKCQQTKDFFGRPCKCLEEIKNVATKTDQYNKVMSGPKDFLNATVQQGEKSTLLERSKKQQAQMAQIAMDIINKCEKDTDNHHSLSNELLWNSPNNRPNNFIEMPWTKETREQFNHDLYKTIPSSYKYDFMWDY
ncbi:MAG TPA: hypothetical protein VHX42_01135 [Candidatus Babeliales bacterium]|jgi:hypothetical protein|nr:hypothetical protein [Candidatus Babeliales bacterium]